MNRKYAKKGMVLIGAEVQGSGVEAIEEKVKEHKIKFTVTKSISGPNLSDTMPHMAVFDISGNLLAHGHPNSTEVERAIKKAMKDATPPVDSSAAADPFAKPKMLVDQRQWTNTDGKKLNAALVSLEGSTGKFRFPNGRTFNYDITKLSAEDQALIKEKAPDSAPEEAAGDDPFGS